MDIKELIKEKVKSEFGDNLEDVTEFRDELTLTIKKESIVEVCKFLKEDPDLQFVMCKDVTAIDWATRKNRFSVVYNIYSFKHKLVLILKAAVEQDDPTIDSVTSVWSAADWYERETYDMYGINFNNHPDLRRMYMPEEFEHYPLRKEFPVMGIPGSIPLPNKDV